MNAPPKNAVSAPLSRFALGTAQLGMTYGVVNRTGFPTTERAREILTRAVSAGIRSFDTARAYGEAENRLGEILPQLLADSAVITKLAPLDHLTSLTTNKQAEDAVEKSIEESCAALRLDSLPLLLLHRWSHHDLLGGVVWKKLVHLKTAGKIGRLGVSVNTPQEALEAMKEPLISHLQIPFNILDWRWNTAGIPALIFQKKKITVHARSIFLQGVLAQSGAWPLRGIAEPSGLLEKIDSLVSKFKRESRVDLCVNYVRAQRWVSSLVIGIDSTEQLEKNIEYFYSEPLTRKQCAEIDLTFAGIQEEILMPSRWPHQAVQPPST